MTWSDGDLLTPANLNSKGIGANYIEGIIEGPLYVGTYVIGKHRVQSSWTISRHDLDVVTAPTGQSLIWKVWRTRSGSDTLICTTTMTAGATTASTTGLSVSLEADDIVWDEITQVGSSNTGITATSIVSARA